LAIQLHFGASMQMQSSSMKQSEAGQLFVPRLTRPGLTVRINLSLIEDLGVATIDALKSVPKRGLEIGGILLGWLDAAQSTIVIEDHEPVDSEHLHGPSWLLSPKDRSAFQQTLDRLCSRSPQQLRPVGFYRSQTRDGLSFDDQDNAIMREIFYGGSALCMLVKPSLAEPSVAQIGMRTEDLLQPVTVFPFHAGVLREGDFQIVEDSSPVITPRVVIPEEPPPQPAPLPLVPVPAYSLEPALKQPRRIPLTATLLAIAAAILLCVFLFTKYRRPHAPAPAPLQAVKSAPAPTIAPIAAPPPDIPLPVQNTSVLLNVKRQDRTATLSWNPDAPTVKGADYALLRIEDGRNREQLHLNKTELETGRLVYIPRSRNISFHLQLFAQSQSTTESIRSVPDIPAPPAPESHPNARSLPATARLRGGVQPEPAPTAPSTVPPPSDQTNAPPAVAQPAPPQEPAAESEASKPTPFAEPDKTTPKPREPEVVTTVSLELIGRSGIGEVFGALSPRHIFGSGSDKTTPPRIIRQILPGIYPPLTSRIHGTKQVDVKVTIGPGGQVVKTELVDDRAADPVDSAVYYAARQWTFEPARNGDKPVESKVLMHFVLKRSN
jgi:protein TonB